LEIDTNPATYTTYVTLPQGAQGPAATITAGTVTLIAPGGTPTVTNSGSSSAAVFNFQIPSVDAINELTDVTITSVGDGELLVYDNVASVWVNQTKTEAGFGTLSGLNSLALDDLTDVDLTTNAPTSGQTLTYNGTNFVPTTPLNPLIYAIALG